MTNTVLQKISIIQNLAKSANYVNIQICSLFFSVSIMIFNHFLSLRAELFLLNGDCSNLQTANTQ